jgi:hypothetical protein
MLAAQEFRLQIRPHLGDTIPMRLEQSSEMTGIRKVGGQESTSSITTDMRVYSRTVVEAVGGSSTTLLTITDSAFMSSTDQRSAGRGAAEPMVVRGMRVRLRLSPEGTVEMADGTGPDVAEALSLIPAALPKGPVSVGDTWSREMSLPSTSGPAGGKRGRLHARFRLDSVGRGGDVAYLSMRGELLPDEKQPVSPTSPTLAKGKVTGAMQLDRKRGWLTESHFDISMESSLVPPAASGISAMRFLMRVTQRMRTLDAR